MANARSDRAGDATPFVEFSLTTLRDGLAELLAELRPERETSATRLQLAHESLRSKWFSRLDYLRVHKALSTATASRDLKVGTDRDVIERRGDRRSSVYRFRA